MVSTDTRFILRRKQSMVAVQKNSPIQFRSVFDGHKDYFKEKENIPMDVSPLFIPLTGRAGTVRNAWLCADSLILCEHGTDPALPPLKVSPSRQYFQWGRKFAQANNFHKYWSLLLPMCKADLGSRGEILFRYFFFPWVNYWSTKFHLIYTRLMEETKFGVGDLYSE